ncbi:MAG: hypothetical protein GYB26_02370 [Gammaproteobacteria bacterium]|uniref:Uncharacterized protein n=1 Tax=Marinobacter litoralis TaxID=187981 RepID=A0A3M2RC64_9GAMM|nr:hypothetical protein [Marinobacter litoralis]MBR9869967.1 hypothetical protein [Gammaproteobacteria bacterium]RMJ02595.1 hypothetical protein DOQ08_02058 [Marinobacter litoralis]
MRIRTLTLSWALLSGATSSYAQAGNLDVLMQQVFPSTEVTYIGYESIEREDIPASADVDRKYLVVDFRFKGSLPSTEKLQAKVHQVCMTMFKDQQLMRSLSDSGYDMVSVAFDRQSQFDCL